MSRSRYLLDVKREKNRKFSYFFFIFVIKMPTFLWPHEDNDFYTSSLPYVAGYRQWRLEDSSTHSNIQ